MLPTEEVDILLAFLELLDTFLEIILAGNIGCGKTGSVSMVLRLSCVD